VVLGAVLTVGRVVSEVATGIGWGGEWCNGPQMPRPTVLTDPDEHPVRRLGIDEHRYRCVQFRRGPSGAWRR
jgi:hypothetical protein